MNATSQTIQNTFTAVEKAADRTATVAEGAIQSARSLTNGALDRAEASVKAMHEAAPTRLSRAATQVDEFAQRSMDKAKAAGAYCKDQANVYSEKAADTVRAQPLKSVMVAAATGAAVATLVTLVTTRKSRQA